MQYKVRIKNKVNKGDDIEELLDWIKKKYDIKILFSKTETEDIEIEDSLSMRLRTVFL